MAKDATLESLRVSVRKLEQAIAPLVALQSRIAGFERKLSGLDQRVAGLLGRRVSVLPDLPEPEPEPAPSPPQTEPAAASIPTAEELGSVLRVAVADLGTQLTSALRELVKANAAASARPPVKNGAAPLGSDELGDLGVDPKSIVAFEQSRG